MRVYLNPFSYPLILVPKIPNPFSTVNLLNSVGLNFGINHSVMLLYDDKNMGAWEMVLHELAKACGIHAPDARLLQFFGKHHTFLSKRFDRIKDKRMHFASAMTLLGYQDGADFHDGLSYLDIVAFIIQQGALMKADLEQLWRRVVFNILVSNTDDHLRDHGFILTNNGWQLSPAYDMNPNEMGSGLTLNISENSNE
jgi:serine/threonine-protein kinase HipA